MTNETRRFLTGPMFPGLLMAAAFLLTLIGYLAFGTRQDGLVLVFPENRGDAYGMERRSVPARRDPAGKIEMLLDELFLGPVTLDLGDTVPAGTRVRSVVVSGRTAYVDLSKGIIAADDKYPISFDDALANLKANILGNVPRVDAVVFTVEGQVPHSPLVRPEEADAGAEAQ